MQSLTILKVGCATDMHGQRYCFTANDLTATAAAYDPATHEAPLVLGHPAGDASSPAHGWIKRLTVDAAGALVATVEHVSDALKSLVRAGRFRNLSASFWPPTHPSNPTPGVYALRHVGALGASPPAIRGLSTLSSLAFAEPLPWPTCPCADASDFMVPSGWTVDPERLADFTRITNLAAREGLDFITAARRLA